MMRSAANLIKIAEAEVGYMEKASNSNLDNKTANSGPNNYTKYGRDLYYAGYYNNATTNGRPWCNSFVDWCFYELCGRNKALAEAMLYQTGVNTQSNTGESKRNYEKHNAFYPRGQNPLPGDQIYFYGSEGISHTGIVVKVDSSRVYTIEGNTSGASGVVWNGGSVCSKSYPLTHTGIAGYGRPIFETKSYGSYPFYPRFTCPTQDEDWYKDSNWQKYNAFGTYYGIWRHNGVGGGNCTAYAWGRFWEALDKGLKKDQDLKAMCVDETGIPTNRPSLSTFNAGGWFANTADGYARGQEPELGAVMVWKNSGAGHVAVVEQIFYKPGTDEIEKIKFSNSGWGWSDIFRVEEGSAPNWGRGSGYRFQGFIYPRAADKLDEGSVYQNPNSLEFQNAKTKEEWIFDYLLNKTSLPNKKINIDAESSNKDHLPNLEKDNNNSTATKTLQGALEVMGYYTSGIDGIFGSKTEAAVKQLQKSHNLEETGKVTYKEWNAITKNILNNQDFTVTLSKGKGTNAEVKRLQVALRLLNFYTSSIDGSFGNLTAAALKKSDVEQESISTKEQWGTLKNQLDSYLTISTDNTKEVLMVYPTFAAALLGIFKQNSNVSELFMGDNNLDCDALQYVKAILDGDYNKSRFIIDRIPFGIYGWDNWKDKKAFYEYWTQHKNDKYDSKDKDGNPIETDVYTEKHIGHINLQLDFLLDSLQKKNATLKIVEVKIEKDENDQDIEVSEEKEYTKSLYEWCQYYGELNDIDNIVDLLFNHYKISIFNEAENRKTAASEYYHKYWTERELSESMYYENATICEKYQVLCPKDKDCEYCELEICPICGKYLIYLGIDDEGNSYYINAAGEKTDKKEFIGNHIHYDLDNLTESNKIIGIKHKYNNKNINPYSQKGASSTKLKTENIKGIILHITEKPLNKVLTKTDADTESYYNIGELIQLQEGNQSYTPYHYCIGEYSLDDEQCAITLETSSPEYKINQCGAGASGTLDDNYLHVLICANSQTDKVLNERLQEETAQLITYLCKKYSFNPIGTHSWARWEYALNQEKEMKLTKTTESNTAPLLNGADLPYVMSIDEAYRIKMANKKSNFLSDFNIKTDNTTTEADNTTTSDNKKYYDIITLLRTNTGYKMYETPYDYLILGNQEEKEAWLNSLDEEKVLKEAATSYYIYSAYPGYAWLRLLGVEYKLRGDNYEAYSAPCIYQASVGGVVPTTRKDNGEITGVTGYPIYLDNKSLIQLQGTSNNNSPLQIVTSYTTQLGDRWIDRTKAEANVSYNLHTDIKVSGFNDPADSAPVSSGVRLLKGQAGEDAGLMNVPKQASK